MADREKRYDVIVLGAGASGLVCAAVAGARGLSALLIDHNERPAAKVRVTGGGRCNFTNRTMDWEHYISENPRFCISALKLYPPEAMIAWVKEHGMTYEERDFGRLFLTQSATQLVDGLCDDARRAKADFALSCSIEKVERDVLFAVHTARGLYLGSSLVIATGGMSYANLGASDLGYRLAKQFGLPVVQPRPGLAPLAWNKADDERYGPLSGISLRARVSLRKAAFTEDVLFTHTGLSGPAILQVSNYWQPGDTITLDLLPDTGLLDGLMQRKSEGGRLTLPKYLSYHLPGRLAKALCDAHGWGGVVAEQKDAALQAVANGVHGFQVAPKSTGGYARAEATVGGIDTRAFSPRTMQSKAVPGLFAIGEVLDVTGQLGGYNLHWAWASAHAAGNAV